MSILQNIYGVFFRPSETFKNLKDNYSPSLLLQGLIVLVLVNLISQGMDLGQLVSSMINWLFFSSLIFLTAYIFVLAGQDYWKTITLLSFTNLPLIFLAPLKILSISLSPLSAILSLAISLWVFNLNLLAISEICSITKRKVLLLYLIPTLALSFILVSFLLKLVFEVSAML